jgi:hypothetical protein
MMTRAQSESRSQQRADQMEGQRIPEGVAQAALVALRLRFRHVLDGGGPGPEGREHQVADHGVEDDVEAVGLGAHLGHEDRDEEEVEGGHGDLPEHVPAEVAREAERFLGHAQSG